MEKDPEVEPVADDLASVALDLLVSEAGMQRSGHNLMLLFGES
jgi:FdhE protein